MPTDQLDPARSVEQLTSDIPSPDDLKIVASSNVPGARHVAGFSPDPDDPTLYQFLLDENFQMVKDDALATGFDIARGVSSGDFVGIGTYLGSMPESLCFVRSTRDENRIDIFLTDDEQWPEIEKYAFTFYRRVWPGVPPEVELLSTLIGSYSPDLIGRIELTTQDRTYILGTLRRLPSGMNAWNQVRNHAAANMYSYADGFQLGKTLRLIHDSMLMAFGYDWIPAACVTERLSERLDRFAESTPVLIPFAPMIREWYRLLDGEVLVQRTHGNICLEQLWLEEDDAWLIGGWEGDIRLSVPERIVPGCALEDLASLQRSLFWASEGNLAWCTEMMKSIMEGYEHPLISPLLFVYVLDKICEEVYIETHRTGGQPLVPLEFLEFFRATAPPFTMNNTQSEFLRLKE
ncbi:MAG: hypothetical protein Q4G50_01945 [Corynebacterium sp.]|uniref:hypothetical protein n=1 Tax=Corynebacterium sp. TaxID=1720 RepID=UPI0026E07035|nr:hypothetical protein [Corynebacterium sp.]MDO5668744.1 hypothetical protein [Corynebacterium sp.]